MKMQVRLIGPVEIESAGRVIEIGPPQQRLLAAALAVDAGRLVSTDSLIDRLWDDAPPGARRTLHVLISKMRKLLKDACDQEPGQEPEAVTVARRSGGYVLQLSPGQVDLLSFRQLADEARRADDPERMLLLRAAVALWQGEPLSGLPGDWAARARAAWRQEYLEVAVAWARAELRSGDPAATIGTLSTLAGDYPLTESVSAALMLALGAAGRPADALARYSQARQRLADELGIDPGTELRSAHQAILRDTGRGPDAPAMVTVSPVPPSRDHPELDDEPLARPAATPAAEAAPPGIAPPPCELPAAVRPFTGRARELAALTAMLDDAGGQLPAAMVISVICGSAGVGKTALAVHWAHQAASRFPGGQLYVNLRGYDPARPVAATDVLAGFLRSLGVADQNIPPEADERAARYRSLLAHRQVLIVLDNAGSVSQVRPLLPGTSTCAVLVTSRDTLAGLVARDGATRLDLAALPLQEAVSLLRTLIGVRVEADPGSAAVLAAQCCRLPLALRVAAELAVARPARPLAALAGELADLRTRLDLLDAGEDPGTALRSVFSWSYRQLPAQVARTFRLLGLHPGPDLESYAAAALVGTTLEQARQALDVLARAHLISPAALGRYGLHDLLRGYARERAGSLDSDEDRQAALARLYDHYLHSAATAMDALSPAERHRRPRVSHPATPAPPLADPAAARDWLDRERATLVAATGLADRPDDAIRLAATLSWHFYSAGYLPEALTVAGHALDAARRTGDRAAEATALGQIGDVDLQQGRLQQAAARYRQSLAMSREAGDRTEEARALNRVGLMETELGHYDRAARHAQEAIAISRSIRDRLGEARALGILGLARRRQGRYQEAAAYYQQALELSREIGDRLGEGNTLGRLGVIDLKLGLYEQAAQYFEQALALLHEMGDAAGEAEGLISLGEVCLGLGRHEQAIRNFERALALTQEIGDRVLESRVRNGLGDVSFRTGDVAQARTHYVTVLRLASGVDSPEHQARAHSGLARASQAGGDLVQARQHWLEALTHYTVIGAPEAHEIRARLAIPEPCSGSLEAP
jgi:DNA-binding SARP family transcriptional activator/tetratricopeptide (TPR) repeat protein